MRFLHLADLHFGKSIHGVSLLENGDQPCWVDRFLALAEDVTPDAVVIAGDVYDRGNPSGEAVQLLDRMLTALARCGIPVMLVAGNHDSGQRLAFAKELLARQNLHIAGFLSDFPELTHVTLRDGHGPVTFWLLPYVFPAQVARLLGDETVRDYDTAVRRLLELQPVDLSERNVLVAHQNVTAGGVEAVRGGSESMVGGVGQIDFTAFDGFDYVALGHIHAPYAVGRDTVRYAGSPLCYHFDETKQPSKGPLLIELGAKGGAVTVTPCLISPLHSMREVRGTYEDLRVGELAGTAENEYIRVVLTDRRVTPEIGAFFRDLYEIRHSLLMEIVSEYSPFAGEVAVPASAAVEELPVERLFASFCAERMGGEEPDPLDTELLIRAGELTRAADPHTSPGSEEIRELLNFLCREEEQS